MRAHLVQLDSAWENPAASIDRARGLIGSAEIAPGDLVVLPEMFATGFSLNIERTADDGAQAGFLAEEAERLGVTVVAGLTVHGAPGRALNRAVVYGPAGELLTHYDKVHPFSFGREPEVFDAGSALAVFEWGGLRVQPAVCYDLRFPELFRAGLALGAEAYVVIANWPDARMHHWRSLLIARAIENQALVIAVNRAGPDPHLNYVGGSVVVGPTGDVLAEAGAGEAVLSAEIDAGAVGAWRRAFPAWRDLRPDKGL